MAKNIEEFIEILLNDCPNSNLQLPDPELVQYYSDLKNRIIWINDEIDKSTLDIISKIIYWNREDKDLPIRERQPIRILFNSPGGELDVQDTIISMIKLSKTPIYGIALGMVASAASLIYLSCTKRFALPSAYFVFHKGSCQNAGGNFNELMAAMDDYRKQVEKMIDFYIENTDYTEDEIKKNIENDWYIRLPEAAQKGVVDEVIESIDIFL